MKTPFESLEAEIVQKITALEREINDLRSSMHSLYPVLNENTPAQLLANTDNYAPGDYAVLRMSTDAARNLTGVAGGKKGRVLWMHNVGTQNLVLVHQSANSAAANRFISPTAANITLSAGDSARLYYDSTDSRWRIAVVTI